MKNTKNPKLEMSSKRPVFFLIGLMLAQLFVLAAFSFKSSHSTSYVPDLESCSYDTITFIDPIISYTPPPPPIRTVISVIENPNAIRDPLVDHKTDPITIDPINQALALIQNSIVPPPVNTKREYDGEYFSVDPEFLGGEEALFQFVRDHLMYPSEALRYEVQGVVYARFVIDKYGRIKDIYFKVSPEMQGYGLEEAALAMIQQMPQWKPGVIDNKPAEFVYQLPIRFQIQK